MKKSLHLIMCCQRAFAAQASYALELKAWVIDGDSEKPYFHNWKTKPKYKDQNITVDVVPYSLLQQCNPGSCTFR